MREMTDEERRIRSYLEAQGAKLSPAELIAKIEAAMADLRAALFSVPDGRLSQRPAGDEWSAAEVMEHVVNAGAHFADGILRILDSGASPSPGERRPTSVPPRSAAEWWSALERDRAVLFDRVRRADPAAHLERTLDHGMFGTLNWRETLLFLRLHDLDHARQLQKIAAALA
jgi:DinB superfamily